ncbi:MAG: GlsB/YeaQ/YmgE family stress response membrane protein [Verrucomicrobia bacterium]|nr:MAG: GlsB/YeaQ/YmgE family stress response membrane protein [Verrucomicrobiota bacterium]
MMGIIGTIIIGLLVGVVAKLIMPGPDPGRGWIATLVLGLAGSFLANWFGRTMGWYYEGHAAGFLASVVGAIVLLLLYRLFLRMRQK